MTDQIDILYIHPTRSLSNTKYSIMPIGVVALLNLLIENGYLVKGINIGIEKFLNNNFSLEEELISLTYKILLVDLHWYEHAYGAIQIANISKSLYPDKPVVIGGFTSTIFAEEILKNFFCVDYVLKGDSEEPIKLLIDFLINNQGKLRDIPNLCYKIGKEVVNQDITYHCNEIDSLDYITYDFMKNKEYHSYTTLVGVNKLFKHVWLFIARGCIYNCSYCDGSNKNGHILFGRNHMLVRDVNKVAQDIEKIIKNEVQVICPTHDFQMFGKKYYAQLFYLLRKKNIKPGLYLESFQLPTKEFIYELINTFNPKNIKLAITALSGDEEVRRINGKHFSNEQLLTILDILIENEIKIELYYSLNLPCENVSSFQKTLEQMSYISKKYSYKYITVKCEKVTLDPIAPMREEKYHITAEMTTFIDYYNYCKMDNDGSFTGYVDINIDDLVDRIEGLKQWKRQMIEHFRKKASI